MAFFSPAPSRPSGYYNECKWCHNRAQKRRGYLIIFHKEGVAGLRRLLDALIDDTSQVLDLIRDAEENLIPKPIPESKDE